MPMRRCDLEEQKLKLGVATNVDQCLHEEKVAHHPIFKHFHVTVCGDEVGVLKPDPAIFLRCAHRLNVRPENCLVFEDSKDGLDGPRRAGMATCFFSNREPVQVEATVTITAYDDFKLGWFQFRPAGE
jgi:HAD superfamily hydrolase (TIGR01509 family)